MSFPPGGLLGDKVRLEPFGEQDISPTYLSWLNDPHVVRFSNQRFRSHTRESSAQYLRGFDSGPNLFLLVRDAASSMPVGTMTAYVSVEHRTADIGLMIGDKTIWGKGFGLDAWKTLLDYLLSQASMRKVTGGTLACNVGMRTVMERAGMHLEATRKAQELVEGNPQDILLYARFKTS